MTPIWIIHGSSIVLIFSESNRFEGNGHNGFKPPSDDITNSRINLRIIFQIKLSYVKITSDFS